MTATIKVAIATAICVLAFGAFILVIPFISHYSILIAPIIFVGCLVVLLGMVIFLTFRMFMEFFE